MVCGDLGILISRFEYSFCVARVLKRGYCANGKIFLTLYFKNGNVKDKCNDGFDDWIVDSFVGDYVGFGICVFYEETNVDAVTENIVGFCLGGDGGCFGVVAIDSCDGYGGR